MPKSSLQGKRILVTHADAFMGPVLCDVLARHGATVLPSTDPLREPEAPAALIAASGQVDVLVANLAIRNPRTSATDVDEAEWREVFAALVDPLPRLCRAALPAMMLARRSRQDPADGQRRGACAGRGAPPPTVRLVAPNWPTSRRWVWRWPPQRVQVNAIAQNLVDNPTYFPPEVQADPRFQERLKRDVPLGRLVSADEDAQFAAYLCSTAADCFVGQVFPVCGGWVQR
jgi:2-keto-3-deoxy-L-fuconate dehydrogenase